MRYLSLLVISVLVLVGVASALDPVNVAVTSSSLYMTADNKDSVVITVSVFDGSSHAIGGAAVQLSVRRRNDDSRQIHLCARRNHGPTSEHDFATASLGECAGRYTEFRFAFARS